MTTAAEARTCAAGDCPHPVHAGGYCHSHYARWRRYGDPWGVPTATRSRLPDVASLAAQVNEHGCAHVARTYQVRPDSVTRRLHAGGARWDGALWTTDRPAPAPPPAPPTQPRRSLAWQDRAACADAPDPEIFHPISVTDDPAPALAYCRACPVRLDCLDFALDTRSDHGIYGGLTEQQRAALRRQQAKAGAAC